MKYHPILVLLAGLLVLSACQPAIPPQPVSSPTAKIATTTPAPAKPTSTLSPAQATEANAPTATPRTPPPSPTPIPESWEKYENKELELILRYPESWQLQNSTSASGPDGFFEISTRPYPASKFDSLFELCVLDANNPELSALYGPLPTIHDWQSSTGYVAHYGCVVSPAGPDGSQAILYTRDTRPETSHQLITLRADAAHFGGILSSLWLFGGESTGSSNGYYDSPACKETPKIAPISTIQVDRLVIHEYAISNAGCDPWLHIDGFRARESKLAIDRKAIQKHAAEVSVEEANRTLEPFGVQMALYSSPSLRLLRGTDLIVKEFYRYALSVNSNGDDFIFWASAKSANGSNIPLEVSRDSVRELTVWDEGFSSTWAGKDLVTFEYSKEQLFPIGSPSLVDVFVNGQKTKTISIPRSGSSGASVRGLWSWQNHWVMEIKSVLFVDGEMQNPKLGYEEIFDWHLVKGKPFFLIQQGDSFGIVYDEQELPVRYDDIIHGDLCCSPARYSVWNFSTGALFYALKDEVWYLVSVQTQDE